MAEQELLEPEEAQEETATEVIERLEDVSPDDCGKYSLTLPINVIELRQLSNFISKSRKLIIDAESDIERMALQSSLVKALREAVDGPMLDALMTLQNTPLGFKTDNQGEKRRPYDRDVVADVAIQAFSSGLRMVGNEVNIIAGQLYATKEGFKRLLDELDGFSNFKMTIGIAEIVELASGKLQARIPATASWTYHGKPDSYDCLRTDDDDFRLAIKTYKTDTDDLLRGKAESKLLRRIYAIVTGQEVGIDPSASEDVVEGQAEQIASVPLNDPPPPPSIMDKVEALLNEQLANASELGRVNAVEKAVISKLQKSNCSDEEFAACKEYAETLCEAKREDIRAQRGERSNNQDTDAGS